MILQGDCRDVLATLATDSVQCCVTSPPYFGLRDYGVAGQIGLEPTPDEYVAQMVCVFREVRRVLRPDGTLWLNLGDSYAINGVRSSPPQTNTTTVNGVRVRMARGATASDARANGLGRFQSGLKPKDLIGIPWRVAFALQADGWWLRSDIIWHKPNPMPESVTDRPTKAHEYLFLLTKGGRYFYDAAAIAETAGEAHGKGYTKNPVAAFRGNPPTNLAGCGVRSNGMRNARSVWTIPTRPYSEAHFATFPPELARRCILAGSKPGDTVLDPFNGAGTTGFVAQEHGREYVGIELNPEYVALTERRISQQTIWGAA